jgi:hypothetical protein
MFTVSTDRLQFAKANDYFRQGDECIQRSSFDEAIVNYRKADFIYESLIYSVKVGQQARKNLALVKARIDNKAREYKKQVVQRLLAVNDLGLPLHEVKLRHTAAHKDLDLALPAHAKATENLQFGGKKTVAVEGHVTTCPKEDESPTKAARHEGQQRFSITFNTQKLVRIPDELAEGSCYDLRSDLLMYEFIGLTVDERHKLKTEAEVLAKGSISRGESVATRLLVDYSEGTSTFCVYTYDRARKQQLDHVKDEIVTSTCVPVADYYFSREARACFLYMLATSDTIQASEGSGEARLEGADLRTIFRDFHRHPTKYTDAFVPIFSDARIVGALQSTLRRQLMPKQIGATFPFF